MYPSLITDLASDLLFAAETALECHGLPVPDRSFVTVGTPPFDCDLLAVHLQSAGFGTDGGTPANRCVRRPRLIFAVTLVRCWPVDGAEFDPGRAEEAAQGAYADVWAIMRHFAAAPLDLFGAVDTCSQVDLGAVVRYEPQGGVIGWQFPVTVYPVDLDPPCPAS